MRRQLRRLITVGLTAVLVSTVAVPALADPPADGPEPLNNYDYVAHARFETPDGRRGVSVGMGESAGGMEGPLYVNLSIWDYDTATYCFGYTGEAGVSGYRFHQKLTRATADIPVDCNGTTAVVHVDVTWVGGDANIEVEASHVRDPMYGSNYTWVFWESHPTIESVELNTDPIIDMTGMSLVDAWVHLWEVRGVTLPRLS